MPFRIAIILIIQFNFVQTSFAQNINGKQIYVSDAGYTDLIFNSKVDAVRFVEKGQVPYKYSTPYATDVEITTDQKVAGVYNLLVNEGGRSHRFLIVYKVGINYSELNYDFSNLQRLKNIVDTLKTSQILQQESPIPDSTHQTMMTDSNKIKSHPHTRIQEGIASRNKVENVNTDNVKFDSLFNSAETALIHLDFTTALTNYNLAFNLAPNNQRHYINRQIKYAQQQIAIKKISTLIDYNPKDATLKTIYKKYPAIDFSASPDDQQYVSIDLTKKSIIDNKNIAASSTKFISINSVDDITISLQNIVFIQLDVYIKIQVQNTSLQEFLTGKMLLTQRSYNGKVNPIFPIYISGYPVVLPNHQAVIIYVIKAKQIEDNDVLNFELTDRLNKISIPVSISGKIYNHAQESSSTK